MQLTLLSIVCFGIYTLDVGLIVNGGVPLVVTVLPALLERQYRLSVDTGLALWLTLAVFLHALGALGPYDWFGWYDQVTHLLSSTVVAGAGYATVRALDIHSEQLTIPPEYMTWFIILFVLAFGVLWEILEFSLGGLASIVGGAPVLAQHSVENTTLDLIFDLTGGILVAKLRTSRLRRFAGDIASRFSSQ